MSVEHLPKLRYEQLLEEAEQSAVTFIWDQEREVYAYRLEDGTWVEPKLNIAPGTTKAIALDKQLSEQRVLFGAIIPQEEAA